MLWEDQSSCPLPQFKPFASHNWTIYAIRRQQFSEVYNLFKEGWPHAVTSEKHISGDKPRDKASGTCSLLLGDIQDNVYFVPRWQGTGFNCWTAFTSYRILIIASSHAVVALQVPALELWAAGCAQLNDHKILAKQRISSNLIFGHDMTSFVEVPQHFSYPEMENVNIYGYISARLYDQTWI